MMGQRALPQAANSSQSSCPGAFLRSSPMAGIFHQLAHSISFIQGNFAHSFWTLCNKNRIFPNVGNDVSRHFDLGFIPLKSIAHGSARWMIHAGSGGLNDSGWLSGNAGFIGESGFSADCTLVAQFDFDRRSSSHETPLPTVCHELLLSLPHSRCWIGGRPSGAARTLIPPGPTSCPRRRGHRHPFTWGRTPWGIILTNSSARHVNFKASAHRAQPRRLLKVIDGQVKVMSTYQDATGRIIDPVAKTETYATPCFAHAVAALAASGYNTDPQVLEHGMKAMDVATGRHGLR